MKWGGEGVKRKKGAMFDAAAAAADYHLPQLQQKRSRETPEPEGFAAFFSFFSLTHQKNREKSCGTGKNYFQSIPQKACLSLFIANSVLIIKVFNRSQLVENTHPYGKSSLV